MQFPPPGAESPSQRFEQAKEAARNVLAEVIASANEAGWGTEEIAVALVEAANFHKEAHHADPDPSEDPSLGDAVRQQIGHEEQFD